MSSTPIAAYEPSKFQEPQPFAPYDTDEESFVYRKWEYELMDAPRDCMIRSCWCVSVAQISARVNPGSYGCMLFTQFAFHLSVVVLIIVMFIVVHILIFSDSSMSTLLLAMAGFIIVGFIISGMWTAQLATLRGTVRDRFQIKGTRGDDVCAVFCCTLCSVAQMARQTKSHECGTCDMEPRDALPAYQV